MASVEIYNEQDIVNVTEALENLIRRAVDETLAAEGIVSSVAVEVSLVDGAQMRGINRDQRGIDSQTDVLSFPMLEFSEAGVLAKALCDADFDLDNQVVVLGDVVLSLKRALEQAEDFGHSFEREVAYLTVHSVLHLLGYDHEQEADKRVMREKEEAVLARMDQVRG